MLQSHEEEPLAENIKNLYRTCPGCGAVDLTVDPLGIDGNGKLPVCKRCAVLRQRKASPAEVAA